MKTVWKMLICFLVECVFAFLLMLTNGTFENRLIIGEINYQGLFFDLGEALFFPALVFLLVGLMMFLKSNAIEATIRRAAKGISERAKHDPSRKNKAVKEYKEETKVKIVNGLFVVYTAILTLVLSGLMFWISGNVS